jgi:predicted heme/steroid binding protein
MPRYAPKITEQEFRDVVSAYARSHNFDNQYGIEDFNEVNQIIVTGLMDEQFKGVQGDLKIEFDFENTDVEKIVTLESGVTVAVVSAGGDWEVPLCFAFYYDGKQFRAYIPKDGNPYNRSTRTAYGNDEDEDDADALKNFGVEDYNEIIPDMTKILSDINFRIQAKETYTAARTKASWHKEK